MRPYVIQEGNKQYELGQFQGNQICYDFDKILFYLAAKGKLMFGKKFRIFEEDHEILYKLCNYFIKDESNCKKLGLDLGKGILLSGPVGCGKTCLMRLLRHLAPKKDHMR